MNRPTAEQIHDYRVRLVAKFLKDGQKEKIFCESRHGLNFSPLEQFDGHCLHLRYLLSKDKKYWER